MILSKLSVWFRLLIFISIVWVIGALIYTDPWYRSGTRGGGFSAPRSYSYSNWDEFFLIGILPVVVLWGIVWIVRGFKKGINDNE